MTDDAHKNWHFQINSLLSSTEAVNVIDGQVYANLSELIGTKLDGNSSAHTRYPDQVL